MANGYDYLGRRVWRTVVGTSTVQTHYIFDEAGHLLAEHDGSTGAVLREYVWLDDMPVAMIDSTGSSPVSYFIHTGQIEEPLVMTDASKAKVWDAYVEPYGTATVFGSPSAGLDLRLPGQFTQAETGALSQNWNRDYDTSLGHYIEADPIGLAGGQDVYAYVDGDPLYSMDFRGLDISIEGPSGSEPEGHQSLNVGDPNGSYNSYSFGVTDTGIPYGPDWPNGSVYQDMKHGGQFVPGFYIKSSSAQDAVARRYLNSLLGKSGDYVPWYTCRNFSQSNFKYLKSLGLGNVGRPPKRIFNEPPKSLSVAPSLSSSASDPLNEQRIISSSSKK